MTELKQLLKLSTRNVFRNKRRTLLTLIILILGSTGLILVGGFFTFIIDSLAEYFIYSQSGHLQVGAHNYYERGSTAPFEYLLEDSPTLQATIEQHPQVLYTVPRLKFDGMLSSGEANMATMVIGVDPERERLMTSHSSQYIDDSSFQAAEISEGKNLDADDPYGIILGRGLLNALDLNVGDTVTLLVTREFGTIDGSDFHVRGVFTTLLKEFDERVLKMNMATAQELYDVPEKIHNLLVVLEDTSLTDTTRIDLLHSLNSNTETNLEAITWEQQAIYYKQSKDFLRKIYITIQIIIGVIFFFSIANTINMNLFERMREFGTMMALGNKRHIIIQMIMLEGFILGFIGALAGLIIGCFIAKIISSVGITMPPPPMGSYDYPAYIVLELGILVRVFLVVVLSTLLASIIPAYRASHFRIVAALGYI